MPGAFAWRSVGAQVIALRVNLEKVPPVWRTSSPTGTMNPPFPAPTRRSRVTNHAFPAPTGRNVKAQGIALGLGRKTMASPVGA